MQSKRLIPVLIVPALLLVAPPALAASCTVAATNAVVGPFACTYTGTPPTASVTATVTQGTVSFLWTCGTSLPTPIGPLSAGSTSTTTRARAVNEICTLSAEILQGNPASFTATAF